MFLVERIIGISTYVAILLLIFLLLVNNNINLKKILNLYTLILTIMAFFYIPPPGEDLCRIFEIMQSYRQISFSSFISSLSFSSIPIALLLYYIIAKIGFFGLLPAIVTFITFKNIFYIICDVAKKNNIENKSTRWLVIFIMATGLFGYLVTNIRALLSLSIISRCFYDEFINEKNILKDIPLYLITVFIHPICFFVILIRIFYYIFFDFKVKKIYKFIILTLMLLSTMFFKNYYIMAIDKFYKYLKDGNYFWIYEFIKLIFLDLYVFIFSFINKNNKVKKISNYITIVLIMICIIGEFNLFMRVSYFCAILFLPIFGKLIVSHKKDRSFNLITFLNIIIILLISCTRCHLSSYKFFLIK